MKRVNALKHATQTQQHRLEGLHLEFQRVKPEASGGAQSADARTRKEEEDAMVAGAKGLRCDKHGKPDQKKKKSEILYVTTEPAGAGEQFGEDPV